MQKQHLDIYAAYHKVDQVIEQLKSSCENIDTEFQKWYDFTQGMGEKMGVGQSMPRLAPRLAGVAFETT